MNSDWYDFSLVSILMLVSINMKPVIIISDQFDLFQLLNWRIEFPPKPFSSPEPTMVSNKDRDLWLVHYRKSTIHKLIVKSKSDISDWVKIQMNTPRMSKKIHWCFGEKNGLKLVWNQTRPCKHDIAKTSLRFLFWKMYKSGFDHSKLERNWKKPIGVLRTG